MDWEEYDIRIVRLVFIFFSTISIDLRGGEGYPIHQPIIVSTLQIITNSMDRITFCIVLLVIWAVATGIYFYCQRVKVGENDPNEQDDAIENETSNTNIQEESEEERHKKEERKERILQVLQTKQIVNDEDNSTSDNSCDGEDAIDTIPLSYVHKTCGEQCNICLSPFNIDDYVSTQQRQQNSPAGIRCRHIFHTTCIEQWLLINDGCPICRSSFDINEVERVISEAHTVVELESQQDVNNV